MTCVDLDSHDFGKQAKLEQMPCCAKSLLYSNFDVWVCVWGWGMIGCFGWARSVCVCETASHSHWVRLLVEAEQEEGEGLMNELISPWARFPMTA